MADQVLRQARNKAHEAERRDLRRVAGHLAGYGTLLTYIWHQRRTQKESAGYAPKARSSAAVIAQDNGRDACIALATTLLSGELEKYEGNPLPGCRGKDRKQDGYEQNIG